jgi:chemotaxis protein histidine kinase CheA
MAKSVEDLPEEIQHYIDVRKWDMRTLEGNQRFLELKGRCLPTISLEGELLYESLIPGQEELTAEIIRRWKLKNKGEGRRED